MDTISRRQFFRSYPQSSKYLEKYFNPQTNLKLASKGFQFFRAQSYVGYSKWNYIFLRYGKDRECRPKNKTKPNTPFNKPYNTPFTRPFNNKKYEYKNECTEEDKLFNKTISQPIEYIAQSKGYITSYASTLCAFYECFDDRPRKRVYEQYVKTDHDFLGIACDPNVFDIKEQYNPTKGPFSYSQRCFLGENVNKHIFDFNIAFNKKDVYKGVSKYSFLLLIDGHEMTTLVAQQGDEVFLQYIKDLENENILNDTLVVFLSDHGQHTAPFCDWQQGRREQPNFFVHMLYPNKYLTPEIESNLKENSQRLLSMVDLHKSFVQILVGKEKATRLETNRYNYHYAYDVFHEIIHDNRTCKHITGYPEKCLCEGYMDDY